MSSDKQKATDLFPQMRENEWKKAIFAYIPQIYEICCKHRIPDSDRKCEYLLWDQAWVQYSSLYPDSQHSLCLILANAD